LSRHATLLTSANISNMNTGHQTRRRVYCCFAGQSDLHWVANGQCESPINSAIGLEVGEKARQRQTEGQFDKASFNRERKLMEKR
jgi:hypothetical protein